MGADRIRKRDEKDEKDEADRHFMTINAFRVIAWRCPKCGLQQFTERSKTHVSACRRCDDIYTINIPPQLT